MDVLVGSIDVRELLSSADLDSVSPLSAPDLRLLIDRLNHRSLDIKSRVRSYARSHRSHYSDVFSLSSSLSSASLSFSNSLASLLSILSDRSLDRDIRDVVAARRELAEKTEAARVVAVVADLAEGVRASREEMRSGRMKEAAVRIRGMKERLGLGEEEESGEPAVFWMLRTEWTDCFDELQGDLARYVENSVHFEVENGKAIVRCKATTGGLEHCKLYTILEAMEIVGVLDYGLGKVADSMIKYVMSPAICDGSINILIELDEDSVEKCETILRLLPSSEFQEHLDGPMIYARLIEVIKFIHKYVFFENEAWMQCFGRLTWQRMSDLIITYFLSKAVPDDASKVAEFQNIIRDAAEFETFLKEIKFISTDIKDERLSHFTQNVEVHFASKKRNEILAKARCIILQFDSIFSSENTLKGPFQTSSSSDGFSECVDLLFQPEKCFVSTLVSQLMELVHAALKDACLSSTRVAKEFYHDARDALLLYKAIVPVKLEKQLDSISQIAIIIHNDCYYLSQEILGLAFQIFQVV